MDDALHRIHSFADSIIAERRQILEQQTNTNAVNDDAEDKCKPIALLDILLQSKIDGEPMSNQDIREEVETFIFAVRLEYPQRIIDTLIEYFRVTTQRPMAFRSHYICFRVTKVSKINSSPKFEMFSAMIRAPP